MARPLRLCILAIFATVLPACVHAALPKFSAIYVFGDSYCDVGNIYSLSGGTVPLSPPYYNGRFSNGPLWVEHIAGSMGLPMLPAAKGGTDYAFGGARVTADVPEPPFGSIPSVPSQVLLYLGQHGGKADPNALYVLEGGGNDILNAIGGVSAENLGMQIARGLAESENLLRAAGATKFLIPDLLDVSILPAAQANPSFAHKASVAVNTNLNLLLATDQEFAPAKVYRLDLFQLFAAIVADATHFGFTNITTPCLNSLTGQVCADPDHTLFWDVEHPTVFGHSFFAVTVETVLSQ